jgi:hypothetical protein
MLPTASPETLPDPIAPQIPSTTESVAAAITGTQASVAAVAEFAPNTSLPFATPCAVVLSSGLSPPDEERLLRLQSLLGPSTCDVQIAFSPAVTHLVVPARKAVAQKRSLKYIQAILSKVFIVRPECKRLLNAMNSPVSFPVEVQLGLGVVLQGLAPVYGRKRSWTRSHSSSLVCIRTL